MSEEQPTPEPAEPPEPVKAEWMRYLQTMERPGDEEREPSAPVQPALATAMTVVQQLEARAEELEQNLAQADAWKQELAMIRRMLKAAEGAK